MVEEGFSIFNVVPNKKKNNDTPATKTVTFASLSIRFFMEYVPIPYITIIAGTDNRNLAMKLYLFGELTTLPTQKITKRKKYTMIKLMTLRAEVLPTLEENMNTSNCNNKNATHGTIGLNLYVVVCA